VSIPPIKLHPKDILPILQIIKDNDDHGLVRKRIHRYLSDVAPTGSISFRNAVYALSFHTLRVLKLIEGRGEELHLSVDGLILVNTYAKNGTESYYKELAKIVARVDREYVHVLEAIQDLDSEVFRVEDLQKQLVTRGVESPSRGGKLTKWLRLLEYVRFVDKINDEYQFNEYQLRAIDKDFIGISLESFFHILKGSYDVLTSKRRGNPYIPIPEIEDYVCHRLLNEGFSTFDFRRYLKRLYNRKVDGHNVYFSKPGAREANGLRIDSNYYYYVAIFGE